MKAIWFVFAGLSLASSVSFAGDTNPVSGNSNAQVSPANTGSPSRVAATDAGTASEDLPMEQTVDCFYEVNRYSSVCQNTDRAADAATGRGQSR